MSRRLRRLLPLFILAVGLLRGEKVYAAITVYNANELKVQLLKTSTEPIHVMTTLQYDDDWYFIYGDTFDGGNRTLVPGPGVTTLFSLDPSGPDHPINFKNFTIDMQDQGKAITAKDVTLNLNNVTIKNSTSRFSDAEAGGAIHLTNTSFTATDLTVDNAKAERGNDVSDTSQPHGGAIYADTSYVNLMASHIQNSQSGDGKALGDGGAIYVGQGSTLNLNNTVLTHGHGSRGGLIFNAGTTTVTGGSQLSGGSADLLGGGIFNDGELTLDEVTLKDNSQGDGSGSIAHPGKNYIDEAGAVRQKLELPGVNIYAKKDVTITPHAIIDTGDIRVLDKESAVILSGVPSAPLYISISEVPTQALSGRVDDAHVAMGMAETQARYVGYTVARGATDWDATTGQAVADQLVYATHVIPGDTTYAQAVAPVGDNTGIMAWDFVYNPDTKAVVVGQRAQVTYHANKGEFENGNVVRELYAIYDSKDDATYRLSPTYDVTKKAIKYPDVPTRQGYQYIDFYTAELSDVDVTVAVDDLYTALFPFDKDFIDYYQEARGVSGPETANTVITDTLKTDEADLHAYARWMKTVDVPVSKTWIGGTPERGDDVTVTLSGVQTPLTFKGAGKFTNLEPLTIARGTDSDGMTRREFAFNVWTLSEMPVEDYVTTIIPTNLHADAIGTGFEVTNQRTGFNVTYTFVSGTADKVLPTAVEALTPTDDTFYAEGQTVTAKSVTPLRVEDSVYDGVWTFGGWDATQKIVSGEDIPFIGVWHFTPNTYGVTYRFVSGTPDKALPDGILDKVPADVDGQVTGHTVVTTPFSYDAVAVADGTWTFQGWDAASVTIDHEDVTVTGTWVFEPTPVPITYDIIYQFQDLDGKGLPGDVMAQLPPSYKAGAGDIVHVPVTLNDVWSDTPKGRWIFIGWSPNQDVVVHDTVEFIGTWQFVGDPPSPGEDGHITYVFVDDHNNPTPEALNLYLPSPVTFVTGEMLDPPTTPMPGMNVQRSEGLWTFLGWDQTMAQAFDGDTVVTGTWHLTPTLPPQKDIEHHGGGLWIDWNHLPEPSNDVPKPKRHDHAPYMHGYPDHTFLPDRAMTRGEMAAMFSRLIDDTPTVGVTYDADYFDVTSDAWYYGAVGYLTEEAVLTGYPDGSFRPDAPVTRGEFATVVFKFAHLQSDGTSHFTDLTMTHWAYPAVDALYRLGWVKGYGDTTFKPDNPITRGEVVTIVNRMLQRKVDVDFVDRHSEDLVRFADVTPGYWAYYDIVEALNGHGYIQDENGGELWQELNHTLPVRSGEKY
ncbi:SHIRT domain-containing protein [Peptoniphilus equinus]|uniref:SHIRT domain-containing protein n=1 Tax=Peptoniphilus equinus TaxID=3016343 RepID=A0ABY7QSR3_9FIRM|nr:SHIRT domain-containing protein [Peptoniphilus equinus]WBW49366.1 SHIRT domain-containing protein [Peptoniphilus equinus]